LGLSLLVFLKKGTPMRTIVLMMATLALGCAVAARSATPAEIIEARQTSLKAMGKAMKSSAVSFKSGSPDAALIRANAAVIAGNADKLATWFPVGTGPGGTTKTAAKAEIWTDPAGFAKAASDFSTAAKAFGAAAQGSDLAATSAAMATLGSTCKACHDKYREKD
jgi:cytochrome c556